MSRVVYFLLMHLFVQSYVFLCYKICILLCVAYMLKLAVTDVCSLPTTPTSYSKLHLITEASGAPLQFFLSALQTACFKLTLTQHWHQKMVLYIY